MVACAARRVWASRGRFKIQGVQRPQSDGERPVQSTVPFRSFYSLSLMNAVAMHTPSPPPDDDNPPIIAPFTGLQRQDSGFKASATQVGVLQRPFDQIAL